MFRKLVENISFSPALIESLSRYAKILKREDFLRRLGLITLVLALVIQAITALYPSEQANTASKQDFIYGGVSSLNNLIDQYDKNESHLRDITTTLGITKQDLLTAHEDSYSLDHVKYTINSHPTLGYTNGELSFNYTTSNAFNDVDKTEVAYVSPVIRLSSNNEVVRQGFVGNSDTIGWFAIDKHNGNITLKEVPSSITPNGSCLIQTSEGVQPKSCPDIFSQSAYNDTQNKNATDIVAQASDKITYTFTAKNPTQNQIQSDFKVHVSDILEYAQIIAINDGGIINKDRTAVQWSQIQLQPGESKTHTITAKVLHDIPATSQGYSNPNSYDCVATTVFSSVLEITIQCPAPKIIESLIAALPKPTILTAIAEASFALIAAFLYFRSRQLKEEVRLIRRDINTGSIV